MASLGRSSLVLCRLRRLTAVRHFGRSSRRQTEIQKTTQKPDSQPKIPDSQPKIADVPNLGHVHAPHATSGFDKKMLVWAKMYPTMQEVPETVSFSRMKKAKDLMRVRINLYMIFGTVVCCAIIMYFGRKGRFEGDGLTKRVEARHRELQEQGRQERAEAARKQANE